MKKLFLYLNILSFLFLFSCSERKGNDSKTITSTTEEIDSLSQFPEQGKKAVDAAKTPASKKGPGIGTSENGSSTDVDQTVSQPTVNDSSKQSEL